LSVGNSFKIIDVVTYRGWGGYFFEDIDLIRRRNIPVSERYHTPTHHDLYPHARTPAPVVGVGLKLEDSSIHWGDAVAVSFGGKSGRAGPGTPASVETWFNNEFKPWCIGRGVTGWQKLEQSFLTEHPKTPAFMRYAVSQAFLSAASHPQGLSFAQLIARDLNLQITKNLIPLQGSCGANWDDTVDRMLARHLPYLPQGQFENLQEQIGSSGERLLKWVESFKNRAAKFNYTPTLTLDFHGALGTIFSDDDEKIAAYIIELSNKAAPHPLHVESPIVGKDLIQHAKRLAAIRHMVHSDAPNTKIIADEWANELLQIKFLLEQNSVDGIHIKMPDTGSLLECAEAIKACQQHQVFTLLGGSCTETDLGLKASVHLALACQPDALLVKPGMGFDESFACIYNEAARFIHST
jgi:methylaspartate ammonia-lyase